MIFATPLLFHILFQMPLSFASSRTELAQAIRAVQEKRFETAAVELYNLARRPELGRERGQIQYLLGLSLQELGLDQVAAFQYTNIVRSQDKRYTEKALEQISITADRVGDESLLRYAIGKVNLKSFPKNKQDLLNYRLGESFLDQKDFSRAVFHFRKIPGTSDWYDRANYLISLAFAQAGKPLLAAENFRKQYLRYQNVDPTNNIRVSNLIGSARALYQAERIDLAQAAYRLVPRDHPLWHDAVYELAWSYLREGKFRSALSQFQTLHSDFYRDHYKPESLLLRGIIYLYICQYEELEKTLGVFAKTYGPIASNVTEYLKAQTPSQALYEFLQESAEKENARAGLHRRVRFHLNQEQDVIRLKNYIGKLRQEQALLANLGKGPWAGQPLYGFSSTVLEKRIQNALKTLSESVRAHLVSMQAELRSLNEQAEFLRFEMFNAQKDSIKADLAQSEVNGKTQLDSETDRDFYIRNGYEYWPFDGEFWLDELGNYQYLGNARCSL